MTADIDRRDELVAQFGSIFTRFEEQIALIHLSDITPSLGHATAKLLDLHVPLRSDICVSYTVRDSSCQSLQVRRVRSTKAILSCPETAANDSDLINADFRDSVSSTADKFISGADCPGLRSRKRPLIFSPPWADGEKSELADLDVVSALNVFRRVVLLGPPGSGKTTTAKVVVAAHLGPFASKSVKPSQIGLWGDTGSVPLFAEIRTLVSEYFPDLDTLPTADVFERYIKDKLLQNNDAVFGKVEEYMRQGRAVIVLDGLDEAPVPLQVPDALEKRHDQLAALVDSICTRYPVVKVLVTSRPAGYSAWTLRGFEVIHVRPLSSPEAVDLARAYYRAAGDDEATACQMARDFRLALDALPAEIREFPLFVCLLAAMFRTEGGVFPAKRGALLQSSLDLLLGSWTEDRLGGQSLHEVLNCSVEQIVERLASISLRSLDDLGGATLSNTPDVPLGTVLEELYDLGSHVNPTAVLDIISTHAGILTSPAPRRLRFAHRLFQEYLAADAISRMEGATRIMADRVLGNPAVWTEVTHLFCDILSNSERHGDLVLLIEELLQRKQESADQALIVELAATVVTEEEVGTLARPQSGSRENITRMLVAELADGVLGAAQKATVGRALAEIGDPRQGVSVDANGNPEFSWVSIPRGHFVMGLDENAERVLATIDTGQIWDLRREMPPSEVYIEPFLMAQYPVTVDQFRAFINAHDGYWNDDNWSKAGLAWRLEVGGPFPFPEKGTGNLPRGRVSWYEADAFCSWSGRRLGIEIRLPTEAEWEYVARSFKQFTFPWGDRCEPAYANVADSSLGEASPVGCFAYRHVGLGEITLFDLIGNVWEWCSTIVETIDGKHFTYPYVGDDGREDRTLGSNAFRATRGGYFGAEWMMARGVYRGRDLPVLRVDRQGFRVVASNEMMIS